MHKNEEEKGAKGRRFPKERKKEEEKGAKGRRGNKKRQVNENEERQEISRRKPFGEIILGPRRPGDPR